MIIWIDAQLPPALTNWINSNFDVEAMSLKYLSLRDAKDIEIFEATRFANAVIMTKDSDFIDLVCRLGSPPLFFRNKLVRVEHLRDYFQTHHRNLDLQMLNPLRFYR